MSAEILDLVPGADVETARAQFGRVGHVGLTGLIDPTLLEPAIHEAEALSLRPQARSLGEQVSTLRTLPDPERQHALHGVLEAIQAGVKLLGRDISPSLRGEKPLIQIIRMMKSTTGPRHQDNDALTDVVAIANLAGTSGLWFEDDASKEGVVYRLGAGEVVVHDLRHNLYHRGFTDDSSERVGLAVAKRKTGLLRFK